MSVPSAPQNVTGEQLNATTVRLRWNPPKSPNGIITGFQVTYYGYRTTREVHLLLSESRATSIIHGLFLIIYKLNTYTHLSDIVCLVNTHPIHWGMHQYMLLQMYESHCDITVCISGHISNLFTTLAG